MIAEQLEMGANVIVVCSGRKHTRHLTWIYSLSRKPVNPILF